MNTTTNTNTIPVNIVDIVDMMHGMLNELSDNVVFVADEIRDAAAELPDGDARDALDDLTGVFNTIAALVEDAINKSERATRIVEAG